MKIKNIKLAVLSAALVLSAGGAIALEADTNATTIAYWKLPAANSIALSPSGNGILDLATNTGQGITPPGTGLAPATVQDLWFQGPMAAAPTFSSSAPPSSMFNTSGYFSPAPASWNCGVDELGLGGTLTCDNTTYGNAFNGPDFTWECYFKSDTTNDPVTGTQSQFLIFDHHQSAYAFINLNDNANNDTNQIGCIRFWSYNGAVFGIDCRITAAQNYGHRMDDGHWHYVAARFNSTTEVMDMLVVNDDGTSYETSTYTTVALNPGGSGSQGPTFLGCDEGQGEIFNGQINQLRYSDVSLPNSQLLANASGCNAPVFNNSAATNTVAEGGPLSISAAYWPVQVVGGPLLLQWQLSGVNISGQTNISLTIIPAEQSNAGTYQLVATTPCGGLSVTSAPTTIIVAALPPVNIARWGMNYVDNSTPNNAGVASFVGMDDENTNVGQGTIAPPPGGLPASVDDLITFNSSTQIPGGIGLTNDVPPTAMFINGNNGSSNSLYAAWLDNTVAGALFYPQDQYGDELDFRTSFSLELFFKTLGDQSGSGTMQLLAQGPDGGNFTYGLNVNQAGNGAVSFKINNHAIAPSGPGYEDTNAGVQAVIVSDRNYADGTWHYLLAKYNSIGNTISLSIANQDGTGTNATFALPAGYSPLAAGDYGNMFVGRYRFGNAPGDDPRTFIGMIDEVQVSSGLVTPSYGQLGYVAAPPNITSISVSAGTVTIKFTGAPAALATSYSVVSSTTVNGAYSPVSATVTSLGGGNFQATLATSGGTEFYRIKH
jgi:hypothetical protein